MSGEKNLNALLMNMSPLLNNEEYIFVTLPGSYGDYIHLNPLCAFKEKEGLTLIVPKRIAVENSIEINDVFKEITLEVHSSLNAVGLTATVATKLAQAGVSANVVTAYYHDHIFVPTHHADKALRALKELID